MVDGWAAAGTVREWTGPVGTLDARTGAFEAAAGGGSDGSARRYVAAGGMAQLAEHLAEPVRLWGWGQGMEERGASGTWIGVCTCPWVARSWALAFAEDVAHSPPPPLFPRRLPHTTHSTAARGRCSRCGGRSGCPGCRPPPTAAAGS